MLATSCQKRSHPPSFYCRFFFAAQIVWRFPSLACGRSHQSTQVRQVRQPSLTPYEGQFMLQLLNRTRQRRRTHATLLRRRAKFSASHNATKYRIWYSSIGPQPGSLTLLARSPAARAPMHAFGMKDAKKYSS
jgi:hypothetical protein